MPSVEAEPGRRLGDLPLLVQQVLDTAALDAVTGSWLMERAAAAGRLAGPVTEGTLYREDHSTIRTRSGPRAMATLRNLTCGLVRP